MISLKKILNDLTETAKEFDGEITLKNNQRQYVFVNQHWLQMVGLEEQDALYKIDAELFAPSISMQIMLEDKKALENKLPREYLEKIYYGNTPVIRVMMKWPVKYDTGNLFCICTLSVKLGNKRNIYSTREKINVLFEKIYLR